jgi:FKBP-type peptidyl-prolyl cis-trans isomerase
MITRVAFTFACFACALGGACTSLTAPPTPEPIASDTPVTSATAPANGAATAHPSAALPIPGPSPNLDVKLEMKDLVVGKGKEAQNGDTVKVDYVGTLPNGTEFDASKKHGKPFEFTLGQGRVIKGWDLGLLGMKVGGKRKLTIPSQLAYGSQARPGIPADSTLVFDVELLDVKPGDAPPIRRGDASAR